MDSIVFKPMLDSNALFATEMQVFETMNVPKTLG